MKINSGTVVKGNEMGWELLNGWLTDTVIVVFLPYGELFW